jgi:hypothetical protein
MRDIKLILVTFALSLILGVFIGWIYKPLPECEKCVYTSPNEVTKRLDDAIEVETIKIKTETNETIKKIITNHDTNFADSVLRAYAKERFNYNK